MPPFFKSNTNLVSNEDFLVGRFHAMGCPCEILLDTTDPALGHQQLELARQEAERVENKYSRYRKDNMIDVINTRAGQRVRVDDETAALLDFAAQCYEMSDGMFDITIGVLRKSSDLSRMGWDKVSWAKPFIQLPAGFEIDLGGICKEYASDKILELLTRRHPLATLVNLGGDITAAGERLWSVGIEDVRHAGQVAKTIRLRKGGMATSGTTKRAGHILNPKTAQPVEHAPASVTVAAKTCTEAGFWSTLAVLHGAGAEAFLAQQGLESWCYRAAAEAFPQ